MFDRLVLVGAGKSSGPIIERLARIAPLTIVDSSSAALAIVAPRSAASGDGRHAIVERNADGTSRLVLEDLRGEAASSVGLVAAPGDDRAAREICRLGTELGYAAVIAIVNDRTVAGQCEKLGARALVRADIVGQLVEQSLSEVGLGVMRATTSGRGEILEFRVEPSSPAIGVPLVELRAEVWRVAAIYRENQLVLPTGATTLEADDRVLIVGDPAQLPHVAESLRVGAPTFPLLHGPNVVVYLPQGRDGDVEAEAELLVARTRAQSLVRVIPHAEESRGNLDLPGPNGARIRKRVETVSIDAEEASGHSSMVRAKRPGVVVTRARPRGMLDVVLGRGGSAAALCNHVSAPVLFPKGVTQYEVVVLCVTDGEVDLATCEIALDLARMFGLVLQLLWVRVPPYLQPADATTERLLENFLRRARLHGVVPEVRRLEGNPIVEWIRASVRGALAVVSRRRSLRDTFSTPDLGLRLARKARGSVLVVTREDHPPRLPSSGPNR